MEQRTSSLGAGVLVGESIGPFLIGAFAGIGEDGQLRVRILREGGLDKSPSSFPSGHVHASSDVIPRFAPPAETDPLAPWRRFVSGEVVAVKSGESSWLIYSVVDEVRIGPHADERPRTIRATRWGPTVGASIDEVELNFDEVVDAFGLTWRAEFKANAPRDQMYRFMAIPVFERWKTDAATLMSVTTDAETISGEGKVELSTDSVSINITNDPRKRFGPAKTEIGDLDLQVSNASIDPAEVTRPSWRAEHAYLHATQDFWSLGGSAYRLRIQFDDGPASATRETFRGDEFRAFSYRVFRDEPEPLEAICAHNAFAVVAFGRKARIYNPAVVDGKATAIVYEGERFDQAQTLTLRGLMNFLFGKRLRHTSTESLADAELLEFEYHEVGEATDRGLPALKIEHQSRATALLADNFGPMLDKFHDLRQGAPMKLDAAFHHYYEGANSNYPTSRILTIAVAIDALAALWWKQKARPGVIGRDIFSDEILPVVRTAMRAALGAVCIVGPRSDQLVARLDGLNQSSSSKRQAAFWRHVDIDLTEEERAVLRTRHSVVHEGYVGDDGDEAILLLNDRRSRILANLFNRAMLRLLGWSGP
jgi:hypothetical protein